MGSDVPEKTQQHLNGDEIAMGIIAYAGDARSFAFGALEAAKKGEFAEADRLLEEGKRAGAKAHRLQTELLTAQANGTAPELSILLVHAQDHLMTGMLAEELIRELIALYRREAENGGEK